MIAGAVPELRATAGEGGRDDLGDLADLVVLQVAADIEDLVRVMVGAAGRPLTGKTLPELAIIRGFPAKPPYA